MPNDMHYRNIDHDGLELTGAQRFISGCVKRPIPFDFIHEGNEVWVLDVKYIYKVNMSISWVHEYYPTEMLREMGKHFYLGHPDYEVTYYKTRGGVSQRQIRYKGTQQDDTIPNEEVLEPDTLDDDVQEPDPLEVFEAYKRRLEEGTA